MSRPFTPYKKEEKVAVVISKREAVLLQKMRRFSFGQITVHKADNIIVRIELSESQLIDEDTEIDKEMLE